MAGVSNFVKLPGNDYNALMNALGTIGPVSISVSHNQMNGHCNWHSRIVLTIPDEFPHMTSGRCELGGVRLTPPLQ